MPKDSKSKSLRHDPLFVQMAEKPLEEMKKNRSKSAKKQEKPDQELLNAKTSRRILSMVKEQQDELEQENGSDLSNVTKKQSR